MGSGYQINLGELGSLITTLETARDSMTRATDRLKNATPRDLGSGGIDSAGKDFQDKWEYGIGKLADLAGQMTGGLQDTKKSYQAVEDAIANQFSAGTSAGTVAGPRSSTSRISDVLSGGAQ